MVENDCVILVVIWLKLTSRCAVERFSKYVLKKTLFQSARRRLENR